MYHQYKEMKVISALNALQKYLDVQNLACFNLKETIRFIRNPSDLTETFHTILYRVSQQLTSDVTGTFNEVIRVRQIGKLRLNQAVYLPSPPALISAGYNTRKINHRITGNGQVRIK